jgi:hypothetical protein
MASWSLVEHGCVQAGSRNLGSMKNLSHIPIPTHVLPCLHHLNGVCP